MIDEVRAPDDGAPPPAMPLIARAARAEAEARARFRLVPDDLFRADAGISDYQRATVLRMIRHLFDEIETSLRRHMAAVPPERSPLRDLLEAERSPVARPLLEAAGLTRDDDVIALLLARANEHRLVVAGPRDIPREGIADPVRALAQDADPALAAVATGLLAAQGRRFDRFRDPVLPLADAPDALARRLVWRTAAALRHWLLARPDVAGSDGHALIASAAASLVTAISGVAGTDECAAALIDALAERGRLDETLVRSLADAGSLPALAAMLGWSTDMPLACVREMMLAPDGAPLALLLRAAGVGRASAGAILLRFAPDEPRRVVAHLDGWDALDVATAYAALASWRVDSAYRDAIAALAGSPA